MMDQLRAGLIGLGGAVFAVIAFYLARAIFGLIWRFLVHGLLPLELRLLQLLQDRSTSRTLGIDIDVLRFRRKVDFTADDRQK